MEISINLAEKVASAVRSCKPLMMQKFSVSEKGSASNLVTTADTAVQERLRALLGKILPQAGFLGEESPEYTQGELYWVVDPIDGTTNFVRGMRLSVISVALVNNNEEVLGVVYHPYSEELFSAVKGQGAFLNGKRIRVSERDFSHSLFFTAFSVYKKQYARQCMEVMQKVYSECDDFRRLGTAALELCYLAAGRGELYFELRLFPWDWAAAAVVLREAGGVVGTVAKERLRHDSPVILLAANSEMNFTKLQEIVSSIVPQRPYTE